jgi:hypothetical protein
LRRYNAVQAGAGIPGSNEKGYRFSHSDDKMSVTLLGGNPDSVFDTSPGVHANELSAGCSRVTGFIEAKDGWLNAPAFSAPVAGTAGASCAFETKFSAGSAGAAGQFAEVVFVLESMTLDVDGGEVNMKGVLVRARFSRAAEATSSHAAGLGRPDGGDDQAAAASSDRNWVWTGQKWKWDANASSITSLGGEDDQSQVLGADEDPSAATSAAVLVEGVFYGRLDISRGVMGLPPLAGWAMASVPFWVEADTGTTTTGKFAVDASIRVTDSGGGVGMSGEPLAEMSGLASFTLPCEKDSTITVPAATFAVRLGFIHVDATAPLAFTCVTGASAKNAVAEMQFPYDFSIGSKPFLRATETAVKLLDNQLVGDDADASMLTFSGVAMARGGSGWFFSGKFVFTAGDVEATEGMYLKVTADLTTESGFPIQGNKMFVDAKFLTEYVDFDGSGQFPIGACSGDGYELTGTTTIRFNDDAEGAMESYSSITRSCEDARGFTTYGVFIEVTNWKYKSYVLETSKGDLTIVKHASDATFTSASGTVIGHIVANGDAFISFLTNVQMELDFTVDPDDGGAVQVARS